jgi:hypothetical protein
MKKFIIISLLLLSVLACKKKVFSPEGPTDIRIRNKSDQTFQEVIVSTSEKVGDTVTVGNIPAGSTSDYFRVTKAYPKAEVYAMINVSGSLVKFSTGPVSYTYMQYIGRDRITYEIYISNMTNRELSISDVIEDEALVLK